MGVFAVIWIIGIIIIVIAVAIGASKVKKQKQIFSQFLNNATIEEQKGNIPGAIAISKQALSIMLGIVTGSTELTPKGIGMLMEQGGKDAVEKIKSLHARSGIQYDWSEFYAIIQGYARLSLDKQFVDNYGLPKGAGKEYAANLRFNLQRCISMIPETALGQAVPPQSNSPIAPPPMPGA
jgi:hypothetical protein